jgi:hypothetical protein
MVERAIDEALLMAGDEPLGVTLSSPRLRYLWRAARFDLYEGLRGVGDVFSARLEELFGAARTVQVAGLVLVAAGLAATAALVARPLSRRAAAEALLVAELLAQLPAGVDCEGLLATAMGLRGVAAGAGGGAGAAGGGASVAMLLPAGGGRAGGGGDDGASSMAEH